jgi:hypothetical protein
MVRPGTERRCEANFGIPQRRVTVFVLSAFCEIGRSTYLRVPRAILYLLRYPERVKAGPSPGPPGRMGLPPARAVRSGRKK